jgi:DUF1680 family protein
LTRCVLTLLSIAAVALHADPPRPVVEPVPDLFAAAPFDAERLGGIFAGRVRANTEGYLERIPVAKISEALDSATPENAAMGRSAGMLLEATSNAYEYSDDEQLKKVMDSLAKALISHQQSSGYVGFHPASEPWSRDDLSSQSEVLLGLTNYYRVTGRDEPLAASRRLANGLIQHLSKGKGAVADAREVVRPLLEIYRATNDGRYLTFCRKLSQSSLAELGRENGTYTFLSFLSGLVDLYQLTGDDAYAKAAVSGWKRVKDDQLAVTGVPFSKEASDSGCLTQAWLRLNIGLLRVLGEARYAEEIERTVYNQLLASQDGDSGKIDPGIPVAGSKAPSSRVSPCSAAISLGITEILETMWGRLGSGVAVLSYQPGRATIRSRGRNAVQLYIESQYPESGSILLHVEPNHDAKFPLQLLVPWWTKSFKADIGPTRLQGKPGQFLTLEREWKKGDTVKISIDMTALTVAEPSHPDDIAIQRGPQVLCLVKGQTALNDLSAVTIPRAGLSLKTVDDDSGGYRLNGAEGGRPQQLTMVPMAEVDGPYRLWIKSSD